MNRYEMIDGVLAVTEVETKSLADVERVIVAGKSAAVTDRFIELYLLSTDPHQAVKDEWYQATQRIATLDALLVDETVETPYFDALGEQYFETTVVRAARELTEEELAEQASLSQRLAELLTGVRKEVFDAALDSWDGTGEAPEADLQERDIDLGVSYPWLATPDWPVHTVDVAAFKVNNELTRKTLRDRAVEAIVVEPVPELLLQGDEVSQTRMARALVVALGEALLQMASEVGDIETPWKTADNRVELVKISALLSALRSAGEAQTVAFTQ